MLHARRLCHVKMPKKRKLVEAVNAYLLAQNTYCNEKAPEVRGARRKLCGVVYKLNVKRG